MVSENEWGIGIETNAQMNAEDVREAIRAAGPARKVRSGSIRW